MTKEHSKCLAIRAYVDLKMIGDSVQSPGAPKEATAW